MYSNYKTNSGLFIIHFSKKQQQQNSQPELSEKRSIKDLCIYQKGSLHEITAVN